MNVKQYLDRLSASSTPSVDVAGHLRAFFDGNRPGVIVLVDDDVAAHVWQKYVAAMGGMPIEVFFRGVQTTSKMMTAEMNMDIFSLGGEDWSFEYFHPEDWHYAEAGLKKEAREG